MQDICKSFGRRFISVYVCAAVFILVCSFSAYAEAKSDDVDKQLQTINERIDRLDAAKQPKMLAPEKDVDFLFEVVIGDIYDAADMKGPLNISDNKQIKTIGIVYHWYRPLLFFMDTDTVTLTFNDSSETKTLDNKDLAPMFIEAKMQAVEKVLGLTKTDEPDLIKRIDRAYRKINNEEWQYDNTRIGGLIAYMPGAHAITTSVALHGYFSYRRFSPGKFWDVNNFLRRFSGFFALGSGSAMDNSGGKSSDIKGPVLSAGIGFDIEKGFTLSAGWSVFSYKSPADQDYNAKNSFIFGITLNSDLLRALYNSK